MNRRQELFDAAFEAGIKLINAKTTKDQNLCAIHLLEPSLDELEDAIIRADRDQFPAIVIHKVATWPMPESYDQRMARTFQNFSHSTRKDWCGDETLRVSFRISKKLWDEYKKGLGLGVSTH